MTMVPAENFSKQHHLPPGGGGGFYGYCGSNYTESFGLIMSRVNGHGYDHHSEACLGSDLVANNPMAEDESRTNSLNEAGSSSKDNNQEQQQEERDEGWLQLGIGAQDQATRYDHNKHDDQGDPMARRGGLIELDLLPGGGGSQQLSRPLAPIFHMPPEFRTPTPRPPIMHSFSSSLFFQHQQAIGSSSTFPHHGEIGWAAAFRPIPQNIAAAAAPSSSSSSSSSLLQLGSYFARPFPVQPGMDVAGPSLDVRIIDPPRRPHSGIWFMLQASQNQSKEPFLPQIPKSFLRIKDGKVTVRLLMKYLVNKLRLDSESEVEITCRGQQLLPFLTLQHVRDQIWITSRSSSSSSDAVTLLPDHSSTITTTTTTPDHVMVLHYGRSSTA